MASAFRHPAYLVQLFLLLCLAYQAQTCTSQSFPNMVFDKYKNLPYLNSTLYWTYMPSNGSISMAYRAPLMSAGWIAWAINPNGMGMVGSEALVGLRFSNGSSTAYTTQVTNYQPSLQPQNVSFAVSGIAAKADSLGMTICANIQLPSNSTTISHVWQQGPIMGSSPAMHPLTASNLRSAGSLDLLSGQGDSTGPATAPEPTPGT